MSRRLVLLCLLGLAGAMLVAAPAAAQQEQTGAPAGKPAQAPNMIEGTVSGISLSAGKLTVGGVAGFLGTDLLISPETQIKATGGQNLALKDIRKGDVIRARYRKAGDQNIATSITVIQAPGRAGGRQGGAGQPGEGAAGGAGAQSGK